MRTVTCNFCGSDQYEERRIEYLYSHKGSTCWCPTHQLRYVSTVVCLLRCRRSQKD